MAYLEIGWRPRERALMATPQTRLDMDRILKSVDAPMAVVIMVDDNGQVETQSKGMTDLLLFWVCYFMCSEIAEDTIGALPQEQRPTIVLPTREEAAALGILAKRPKR